MAQALQSSPKSICESASLAIGKSCGVGVGPAANAAVFYPDDQLKRLLTPEQVQKILDCTCTSCCDDRNDHAPRAPPSSKRIASKAVCLFALLTTIKHPGLIARCLEQGSNDQTFIHDVTQTPGMSGKGMVRQFWPKMSKEQAIAVAQQLDNEMYKFAIPKIDSSTFQEYNARTILPFINEGKIGGGASSTVYSFEIHNPDYYQASHFAKGVRKFVRKQIQRDRRGYNDRAYRELNTLIKVNALEDNHLIELLKAYQHGDCVNLVFPEYCNDLDKLFRFADETFGRSDIDVEGCEAWTQFSEVVTAIWNFSLRKPNPEPGRHRSFGEMPLQHGYHFDLKPGNILLSDEGKWVVTDFGLARFVCTDGRSEVIIPGGTHIYAPPEAENFDPICSDRYDVWSLGCILLELIVWAVRGPEGVRVHLDKVRSTNDGEGTDNSYWEYRRVGDHQQNNDRIRKRTVETFMDDVVRVPTLSLSDRDFASGMWILVKRMLEPKASKRINLEEVLLNLKELLAPGRGSIQMEGAEESPLLSKYTFLYCRSADLDSLDWSKICLGASVSKTNKNEVILEIEFSQDRSSTKTVQGKSGAPICIPLDRDVYMFVPAHGFGKAEGDRFGRIDFFLAKEGEAQPNLRNTFAFAKRRTLAISEIGPGPSVQTAQAAFTGQMGVLSEALPGFSFIKSSALSSLRRLRQSSATAPNDRLEATTIEIWEELPPLNSHEKYPTLRLVIYSKNSLYLIPVTEDLVIDGSNSNEPREDPKSLFLKPLGGSIRDFPVCILDPPVNPNQNDGNTPARAGIPFDSTKLRKREKRPKFEIKGLTLMFEKPEDTAKPRDETQRRAAVVSASLAANAFQKKFLLVKQRYQAARYAADGKEIDAVQRKILIEHYQKPYLIAWNVIKE
ncbi:hypothetical protein MMC07_000015 [Pseudocyphellaria aurata]|nr:hypothetical protein [Pseudocyphellaria aurata]